LKRGILLLEYYVEDHAGALTTLDGKSSSTMFSMAAENVVENSTWFGWLWNAAKSSFLLNVIRKAWVKPCLSTSKLSMSLPLLKINAIKHLRRLYSLKVHENISIRVQNNQHYALWFLDDYQQYQVYVYERIFIWKKKKTIT